MNLGAVVHYDAPEGRVSGSLQHLTGGAVVVRRASCSQLDILRRTGAGWALCSTLPPGALYQAIIAACLPHRRTH